MLLQPYFIIFLFFFYKNHKNLGLGIFYYYFKKCIVFLFTLIYNHYRKRGSTLQWNLIYDPLLIIYTPLIVARWFPHRATLLL